ncbi:MAG: 1-deoxy-D-xylulose-5-phosphate reductoisomerase [Victivallales bacterium]|nr:1-deoxy-D-xylulose-5-phosphate reductoisomerase [Victivallales bacterium]
MGDKRKNIVILGSTGSIGDSTLKVVRHLGGEFHVFGLAAGVNVKKLARQAAELSSEYAVIGGDGDSKELGRLLPAGCKMLSGEEGIVELVSLPEVDLVVCAIVGSASLMPLLAAIRAGKDIALASKEALVMAGGLVMEEVSRHNVRVLPVDSEHSAVFQCIEGRRHEDISRIILTASGGAFRDWTSSQMQSATLEDALEHPTWDMGIKVTVDSATMMNKALEIIEAHWLFDMPGEKIDVIIHHQSVIHSMVEFIDGTMLVQMGTPDMCFPIQYALTYPRKLPGALESLDFARFASLSFEYPDRERFPSLNFAVEAMREGGTMPAVMNAANEVAVERFCSKDIPFTGIWRTIETVMSSHKPLDRPGLDAILCADKEARKIASELKLR